MPERDFAAAAANYFGPEYFNSVQGILTEERTAAEVSFVLSQTALRPPASLVDFGCGYGRHAAEFARRGFDVLGLDANESYLAVARQNSTPALTVRAARFFQRPRTSPNVVSSRTFQIERGACIARDLRLYSKLRGLEIALRVKIRRPMGIRSNARSDSEDRSRASS